ncbi:UNVERIFIED_CONTAM: hypothetical protein FKN15_033224 [Acipenser sinensis]
MMDSTRTLGNGFPYQQEKLDPPKGSTVLEAIPGEYALVINAQSLAHALEADMELEFLETASAHIGVGISGQEGIQAVLASDYTFSQFKSLQRLLLVHGRWSYLRMCKFLCYFFYKNFAFTMVHFWFGFFCGFSAQDVPEQRSLEYPKLYQPLTPLSISESPSPPLSPLSQDVPEQRSLEYPKLYQPLTPLSISESPSPPLSPLSQDIPEQRSLEYPKLYQPLTPLSISESPSPPLSPLSQDVPEQRSLEYPKLYEPGQLNLLFNKREFFICIAQGIYTSVVLFFVSYGVFADDVTQLADYQSFAVTVATSLVIVVSVQQVSVGASPQGAEASQLPSRDPRLLISDAGPRRRYEVQVRGQEEFDHGQWSAWSHEAYGHTWADPIQGHLFSYVNAPKKKRQPRAGLDLGHRFDVDQGLQSGTRTGIDIYMNAKQI